jgi:methionine-S-sulfoxide reductase
MINKLLVRLALAAAVTGAGIGLSMAEGTQSPLTPVPAGIAEATFAAGCFWCSEKDFEKVAGVTEVVSGYTGGSLQNPTYHQVGTNLTGHFEAVRVRYDPKKVSYDTLLDTYWHNVDFLDGGGQFCDRGSSYRPAIFVHDDAQKAAAQASKAALSRDRNGLEIAVQILPASDFTPAEDYHQDYYKTNPMRYKLYRSGCGRDARLQQLWPNQAAY